MKDSLSIGPTPYAASSPTVTRRSCPPHVAASDPSQPFCLFLLPLLVQAAASFLDEPSQTSSRIKASKKTHIMYFHHSGGTIHPPAPAIFPILPTSELHTLSYQQTWVLVVLGGPCAQKG